MSRPLVRRGCGWGCPTLITRQFCIAGNNFLPLSPGLEPPSIPTPFAFLGMFHNAGDNQSSADRPGQQWQVGASDGAIGNSRCALQAVSSRCG